jgi:hypothetical protein
MKTSLGAVWRARSADINRILTKFGSPVSKDPLVNKVTLVKCYLKVNQLNEESRAIVGHPLFAGIALNLGSLADIKVKVLGLNALNPIFNDVNLGYLLHDFDEYVHQEFLYIFVGNVLEIRNLDATLSIRRKIALTEGPTNTSPLYYKGRIYFLRGVEDHHRPTKILHCLDLDSLEVVTFNDIVVLGLFKIVSNMILYSDVRDGILSFDDIVVLGLFKIVGNMILYSDVRDGILSFDIETGKVFESNIVTNGDKRSFDGKMIYNLEFSTQMDRTLSVYDGTTAPPTLIRTDQVPPGNDADFYRVIGSRLYFNNLEIYDLDTRKLLAKLKMKRYEDVTDVYEYGDMVYVLTNNHEDQSAIRVYSLISGELKKLPDLTPFGPYIISSYMFGSKLAVLNDKKNTMTVYDLSTGQKGSTSFLYGTSFIIG